MPAARYTSLAKFIDFIGIIVDHENPVESVPFVSSEGQFSGVDGLTEEDQKFI